MGREEKATCTHAEREEPGASTLITVSIGGRSTKNLTMSYLLRCQDVVEEGQEGGGEEGGRGGEGESVIRERSSTEVALVMESFSMRSSSGVELRGEDKC